MNVLFIGNSFTQRNNLPGLIAKMAEARGHELRHTLISAGGASLRQHWNAGKAPRAIESGGYDRVVLQEQSTLPVKNAARMAENVRLFDAAIKAAGARTVLYLTWARAQHARAGYAAGHHRRLHHHRRRARRHRSSPPARRGGASSRSIREPVLHDKDQSHPALAGSYLAACAFYAVLFEDSPVGIDADGEGPERRTSHAAADGRVGGMLPEALTDALTAVCAPCYAPPTFTHREAGDDGHDPWRL